MSDKDPVTTVHEKTYFYISNGLLAVEIASTSDGKKDTARLSFVSHTNTTHVPIIDVDFLQKLSDMALRAKAALAPLKLDPDKKVTRTTTRTAGSGM